MLGLVMMIGFGRVQFFIRSCISCLRQKQLSVLGQIFYGNGNIH